MAQLKNEPATPVLLQTTTATMATLEDKFKNLKGQGGYAPLVMTLATLMTAQNLSDQTMVQKIIDMIDELKTDLEETLTQLSTDEAAEIENHENLISSLDAAYNDMGARLATAEVDLQAAQTEKLEQEGIVESTQTTIDDTSVLLEDHNKACGDEEAIYNEETESR